MMYRPIDFRVRREHKRDVLPEVLTQPVSQEDVEKLVHYQPEDEQPVEEFKGEDVASDGGIQVLGSPAEMSAKVDPLLGETVLEEDVEDEIGDEEDEY